MTLRESNITENLAGICSFPSCQVWPVDDPRYGGGIFTSGPLTLYDSTVHFNGGENFGGGIFNAGATVKLFSSTVSNNLAFRFAGNSAGGGIFNAGTMTLYDSDVSDNSTQGGFGAHSGGGIYNEGDGTLVLRSSTVTGNRSDFGGGISNGGTLSLYDTTITGNTASGFQAGEMTIPYPGGGIINSGVLNVFDSVISGNTPNDCTQTSSSPPHYAECSL